MYICIDDVIDAAFQRQDNIEILSHSDSSYLDEEIRGKLYSLEVAERTNKLISKREAIAREERERLLALKRQQIAEDLLRKEKAAKALALKEQQRAVLLRARTLASDVVAGVALQVDPEIAEVVRVCYNIVVDLANMYDHAIDRTKYTLQPQTQWWLGQLDPGLANPVDPRLTVTLDVLREVVNVFTESGFQMSFQIVLNKHM